MRISDWSSDVCSSDLGGEAVGERQGKAMLRRQAVVGRHQLRAGGLGEFGTDGVVAVQATDDEATAVEVDDPRLAAIAGRAVAAQWHRAVRVRRRLVGDRKSTRLNSSH